MLITIHPTTYRSGGFLAHGVLNNMDSDLLLIAKDDKPGRTFQDLALPVRKRAPKSHK